MGQESNISAGASLNGLRIREVRSWRTVLWRVGGFHKAGEIDEVCSAANVACHIGSTPASQLMEAGQLHFAASVPDLMG
jgi:hypothetical protein